MGSESRAVTGCARGLYTAKSRGSPPEVPAAPPAKKDDNPCFSKGTTMTCKLLDATVTASTAFDAQVPQLLSGELFERKCHQKGMLCAIAFLPHILDTELDRFRWNAKFKRVLETAAPKASEKPVSADVESP